MRGRTRQHGRVSDPRAETPVDDPGQVDVLVVGAGPTGLTLAVQLAGYGIRVRIVDPKPHPVLESRALAVQPRSLEVLRGSVTDRLLARGNRAVHLQWHVGDRSARLPLFDLGLADTAYPYLLFLSQAETEAALVDHLATLGVLVEWGTRLADYSSGDGSGRAEDGLVCRLTRTAEPGPDPRSSPEGVQQTVAGEGVRARYVVGCDGARSRVRELAGITFAGGRYPQTFLLADLDADGLDPDAAHVWFGRHGPVFFFPLVKPAAWRLLTPRPQDATDERRDFEQGTGAGAGTRGVAMASDVTDDELQRVVDAATGRTVRLASPVWSTAFRIHHRHAAAYRSGSVFLAGDAAHIHSPAGAQGMNTGIQDAVNLGWKLALVCLGRAPDRLLDTYDRERRPVGAFVLRFTDRAFTAATSNAVPVRFARSHLAPRALRLAARLPKARAFAFRTVSQLGVRYPDLLAAPVVSTTRRSRMRSRIGGRGARHPQPGERLPDAQVTSDDGRVWVHDIMTAPGFHLLLCGPADDWDTSATADLHSRCRPWLRIHRVLPPDDAPADEVPIPLLVDVDGTAFDRWHIRSPEAMLVRPDGHVAVRDDDRSLARVREFLASWLTPTT